jgi:hypothetical protein
MGWILYIKRCGSVFRGMMTQQFHKPVVPAILLKGINDTWQKLRRYNQRKAHGSKSM